MEKSETMKSKGGIAKFQEMSKDWENNPKILRKIIENLSEKIDELQANANISNEAVETFQEIIRNQCDEITALKEKAEAYDRIMSGGKKTLKEWANIFGMPVAIGKNRLGIVFDEIPELLRTVEAWRGEHGYTGIIPATLINYDGDWKDSLTLPDGWGEKKQ